MRQLGRRCVDANDGRLVRERHRHQEGLRSRLVLNELQLSEQRYAVTTQLRAVRRRVLTTVVRLERRSRVCSRVRVERLARQACVGDADEEREQPQPENQGRRIAESSTAEVHVHPV